MTTIATGALDGHEARGTITITTSDGGVRVELTDLWVAPGAPDARLYVTARTDGHIDDTATDLGPIPDGEPAIGRDVPAGVDPHGIGSVVVYCKVYAVLFGYGAVTPTS